MPIDYVVTSGSLIWSVLLYALLAVISYAISLLVQRGGVLRFGTFMLALVVGTGAVNGAVFGMSHGYDTANAPIVTSLDAAEGFGLKSGEAYPLVLGDRVSGTSGEINVTATSGFFRTRANVSATLKPGSAVSVSFLHQDKSYVLEIPMARSTFVQREDVRPTVTLHLNETGGMYVYGKRTFDTSRPCTPVIKTGILVCRRVITSAVQINEPTQRRGLAALIADPYVLDSATFVVTPGMYTQLMGKNG